MNIDPDVSRVLADRLRIGWADSAGRLVPEKTPDAARYAVLGPVPLPVNLYGRTEYFQWFTFARIPDDLSPEECSPAALLKRLSSADDITNAVLVAGDLAAAEAPMIRIHSCCATGDIFGSQRCECGPQLKRSMQMVADEGVGAIVYLADQEGRGIGLFAKAAAYLLQDRGFDTFEANRKLGYPDDARSFGEASFIINFLRGQGRPIRLISNNPEKRHAVTNGGVVVSRLVPIIMGLSQHNQRYLLTKRAYGHLFDKEDLEMTAEDDGKPCPYRSMAGL